MRATLCFGKRLDTEVNGMKERAKNMCICTHTQMESTGSQRKNSNLMETGQCGIMISRFHPRFLACNPLSEAGHRKLHDSQMFHPFPAPPGLLLFSSEKGVLKCVHRLELLDFPEGSEQSGQGHEISMESQRNRIRELNPWRFLKACASRESFVPCLPHLTLCDSSSEPIVLS